MKDETPRIPWLIALVPFAVLVVLQVLVIKQFGSDAIDGASQTVLLFSAAVAITIAMVGYKVSWKTINEAIGDNIKTISSVHGCCWFPRWNTCPIVSSISSPR